jgi:hypothetical protein
MESSVFWDITPSNPLEVNQCFEGTCHMLHDGFLLGLFFDPEDGDNIFPQKTG